MAEENRVWYEHAPGAFVLATVTSINKDTKMATIVTKDGDEKDVTKIVAFSTLSPYVLHKGGYRRSRGRSRRRGRKTRRHRR